MLRHRLLVATICLLAVAVPAFAGYDEGQDFYKEKRYAEAAVEYEKAVSEKPKHAMAHYKLGLTYAQLKRHGEALTSLEKALALDPGLGQRTKIGEAIERARSKAGSAPASGRGTGNGTSGRRQTQAPAPRTDAPASANSMINALQQGAIYVHPAMRSKLSLADEAALAKSLAAQGRPFKVALVPNSEVRKEATSLSAYANKLASYLRVKGDGVVIVASDKGVAAIGGSLKQADMSALVADSLADFSTSYKAGITALADRITARRQTKEAQSGGFWGFLLLIAGAIGGMVFWRRKAKVKKLKAEINQLMGEFSDRMSAAGDDLQYVTSDPRATEAKGLFDEATALFLNVDKHFAETTKLAELQSFHARMKQALTLMGHCQIMVRALINGEDPPKKQDLKAQDAPAKEDAALRAVVGSPAGCFFCSRPTSPGEGSLTDVKQDGRTIRVMACPTCTASIENGQTPQVVGYYDSGRFTPWYERQGYDYHRDRGGLTLGDVMLLNWMFDRPSYHHHHYDTHASGSGWRQDESTAEQYSSSAAEGSLMGSGSSSYSDSGQAAEGSFWSSSSSDNS